MSKRSSGGEQPTEKLCKDCKYFDVIHSICDRAEDFDEKEIPKNKQFGLRECTCDTGTAIFRDQAFLYVGPDFGCVLWESKKI